MKDEKQIKAKKDYFQVNNWKSQEYEKTGNMTDERKGSTAMKNASYIDQKR